MTIFIIQGVLVGLSLASIYILMALGLTIMYGILGVINLAHGVLYMLGAFGVYYFCSALGLNFFVSMFIVMIVIGLFGIIMERGLYRPVGGEFTAVIVITVAFGLILEAGSYLTFGTVAKGVSDPITGRVSVFGISMSNYRLLIIGVVAILVTGLYLLINKTRLGLNMRAVEEDKVAAALQGINPNRVNQMVFFIGIALAGAAGALIAPIYAVEPNMGTMPMCKAFMVIVLGGMGSIAGAICGGIIIGLADSLLAMFVGIELAYIFAWGMIIIILIIRPRGLLGAY